MRAADAGVAVKPPTGKASLTDRQRAALAALASDADGVCITRGVPGLDARRDAVLVFKQLVRKGLARYDGLDCYALTPSGRAAIDARASTPSGGA